MNNLLAVVLLLCTGAVFAAEVVAPVPATAQAVAVPAANKTVLEHCKAWTDKLGTATGLVRDSTKTAAELPFAPASAKTKAQAAQAQATDAAGLGADVQSLLGGKPASSDGLMSKLSSGGLNLGERFKGIPGADMLQQVLGTPGIADALMKNLPVDQVPGYSTVAALFAGK